MAERNLISIHALREEGDLPRRLTILVVSQISIHALREEGDIPYFFYFVKRFLFLSTPSARRATWASTSSKIGGKNFYPRPPRGGRRTQFQNRTDRRTFLSTPSARRATSRGQQARGVTKYFYPRPPRGGRLGVVGHGILSCDFYPRPPRGGRPFDLRDAVNGFVFLSTPSARRATQPSRSQTQRTSYFYPRPPRGGRRARLRARACMSIYFYPRPPRGGRQQQKQRRLKSEQFLSTPSARRATSGMIYSPRSSKFLSTPSARRATAATISEITPTTDFYPRPPRGGRRDQLFTLDGVFNISIHALREEGDPSLITLHQAFPDFYPRPPRGGRHETKLATAQAKVISIHALREEGDSKNRDKISIFL